MNIKNLRPFKKFCLYIGSLPSAYINSMTYYEALTYVIKYLEREVIPTVNNNSAVVEELQNFVIHYFDNLDVQEEINNKLDDMAQQGQLPEIISQYLQLKSVLSFDTVNNMKNGENLIDGSTCKTLGFYEKGDLGSSYYKIREKIENEIIDEITVISLYNENLVAELIPTPTMNVKQFGVKEDNTTDDTENLQTAFNYIGENNNITLRGNEKYCIISSTLDLKVYTKIEGIWFKMVSGTFTNSYLMYINANSGHTDWQQSYPLYIGYVKNCRFYNNSENNYNGIFNYSNGVFEDLHFDNFDIAFRNATKYLDGYKMSRIMTDNKKDTTNYSVYLGYLGDQCVIDTLHLHNGLYQLYVGQGHNGIIINNLIAHGIINIESSNVNINNLHQENKEAIIHIKNSIVKISNASIDHNTNANEHNIEITNNSHVILENIKFNYNLGDLTDNSTDDIDINITSGEVNVINCFKRVKTSTIEENDLCSAKTNLGLTLNNNQFYSTNSSLMTNYNTNQVNVAHGAYNSVSSGNRAKWKLATGTYYYKIQPVGDFERRIAYSQYVNAYNMSLTNGDNAIMFRANPGYYRIYRGSSADTYDNYVDVCHINEYLIDDGLSINGYKWQNRTAGDIDSFQYLSRIEYIGDNIKYYQTTTPSYGTWKLGDITINTGSGDNIGWICTTAGTPGTWKSF